jgi:small subunit ribosomal protein S13
MVHILGVQLPDSHVARVCHQLCLINAHFCSLFCFKFALTSFYGIGRHTAHRICARLQIHDRCKIRDLSPNQLTALAAFLSSPSTSVPPHFPLATPHFVPPSSSATSLAQSKGTNHAPQATQAANKRDPLANLKIESDLKRLVRENIANQRMIGSYVGKRHAMHLPVRGQNTQTNAKTAKKLNRIDRHL